MRSRVEALLRLAMTLLVAELSMKSRTARQVRQTEARRVERHAGDAQRRLAGFVERQLELIAAEQVDAVERRVLRGGGDLRQDAVELVHQVAANRLRRRVDNRRRCGREGDRGGERTADRTACHCRTEGRRSIVVGGGDRQLAGRVQRRVQVVGQQRRIELVERLDRAVGAVAEGDVDRRATVEGGEGQGLAGEAASRRGATRGEVRAGSGVAGEAERRERIAGADDRQVGSRTGRDLQRARNDGRCNLTGRDGYRGRAAGVRCSLDAGRKIDRLQRIGDRAALQIDGRVAAAVGDEVTVAAGAGNNVRRRRNRRVLERDGLAVDVQRRAVLNQRAERGSGDRALPGDRGVAGADRRGQAERLQEVGPAGDAEVSAGAGVQGKNAGRDGGVGARRSWRASQRRRR